MSSKKINLQSFLTNRKFSRNKISWRNRNVVLIKTIYPTLSLTSFTSSYFIIPKRIKFSENKGWYLHYFNTHTKSNDSVPIENIVTWTGNPRTRGKD